MNMKEVTLYDGFLSELRKRIPRGAELTNTLVDMLYIEREAVYRRLRGEVPFTFIEVMTVSKELGISLDNLAQADTGKSRPFQLKLVEYANPLESDYKMMREFINLLAMVKDGEDWEAGQSTNILPRSFCYYYSNITRFYLFKWLYQYSHVDSLKHYSEVKITPQLASMQQEYLRVTRQLKSSYFIFDHLVFHYLVTDIKFFASINLITPEDVAALKEDLMHLLDDMEHFAAKGRFTDTGNEMLIYLSNINLDTNYCYFGSRDFHLSMLKAFTLNMVTSRDSYTYERLRCWLQSLKRSSTLITVSGEKQRVMFFEEQRRLVGSL